VSEEAVEEVRATSGATSLSSNRGRDRIGAVWSEVGQASVLKVAPDLLLWIEFGGVAREPERVPLWVSGEISANDLVAMRLALVPQEEQVPGVVPTELAKEVEHLRTAYILLGVKGQVERDSTAARRDNKGADARDLLVGTLAHDKGGGLSTGSPSSSDQRGHHEARLVEADQACLEASEFFLARVHSRRTHSRIR